MIEANLDVLWIVGANPYKNHAANPAPKAGFLVVQDLFLTETAQRADIVFPAACAYEKNGTITNVTGEAQRLRQAIGTMGAKPDLEIMGLIAREMGVAAALGPWFPDEVFEEIRKQVRGYNVSGPVLAGGGAAPTMPVNGRIPVEGRALEKDFDRPGGLSHQRPALVHSDHNGLFASGTLGRYSRVLSSVVESRLSR